MMEGFQRRLHHSIYSIYAQINLCFAAQVLHDLQLSVLVTLVLCTLPPFSTVLCDSISKEYIEYTGK